MVGASLYFSHLKINNPEPGVKNMWIGLRNMQEHLKAREAYEIAYGRTCGE
jgi:hypothetical protein